MSRFEYMKIPMQWFPQYIIDQNNIIYLVEKDGFVYIKIRNVVYGLKKSARIAFDRLVKLLNPCGYYSLHSNPGI